MPAAQQPEGSPRQASCLSLEGTVASCRMVKHLVLEHLILQCLSLERLRLKRKQHRCLSRYHLLSSLGERAR